MSRALQTRLESTTPQGRAVAAASVEVVQQGTMHLDGQHLEGAPLVEQALLVIEGEELASLYLARLRAQQVDPNELALMVSMLYGATLRGFCRVIEKAMGVRHG